MSQRLVIDETSVYEIDEECMKEKEREKQRKKRETEREEHVKKPAP